MRKLSLVVGLLLSALPAMGQYVAMPGTASAGGGTIPSLIKTCAMVGVVNGAPQTAACSTTGATLLVATMVYSTITDTHTLTDGNTVGFVGSLNTWTCLKAEHNSSYAGVQLCYTTASPTTSSTHYFRQTCTGTCAGYRQNVAALAFNGTTSNPFDSSPTAGFNSGASVQAGSITPSQTNELLVTAWTANGLSGTSMAVDSSFTIATSNTANWDSGIAYLIPSTTSAVNPTWSITGDNGQNALIASFKHP